MAKKKKSLSEITKIFRRVMNISPNLTDEEFLRTKLCEINGFKEWGDFALLTELFSRGIKISFMNIGSYDWTVQKFLHDIQKDQW